MNTYTLTNWTPKAQFDLMYQIYQDYIKSDNAFDFTNGMEIITPTGIFKNFGGFNGSPSDLWLKKKGTIGATDKTFWRVSFGSKKSGFRLSVFDIKGFNALSNKISEVNFEEMAKEIGANYIGAPIRYFTK